MSWTTNQSDLEGVVDAFYHDTSLDRGKDEEVEKLPDRQDYGIRAFPLCPIIFDADSAREMGGIQHQLVYGCLSQMQVHVVDDEGWTLTCKDDVEEHTCVPSRNQNKIFRDLEEQGRIQVVWKRGSNLEFFFKIKRRW